MTISSMTSSSAASQLSYVSKAGSTTAGIGGENGQGGKRPPLPPDGGGFIDATPARWNRWACQAATVPLPTAAAI